jgi:hypothetical protein
MPSLLEILNDPNYVNANQATKEAIFNKYSATDPNYTDANDATKEAIKQRFGFGAPAAKPAEAPGDTRNPEDVGFFEGLKSATKKGFSAVGESASGLGLAGTSVLGTEEETAKKMAAIKQAAAEEAKGTKTLTASDIQRIAEERGLIKAGTQVPAYIAEQILQSAPSMAIPLAVGAAASPFLTPIGGAIAGVATYGIQQFGNFLARQAQEKDDPKELEVAKAALTAAGTAPIGYFADKFTVGLSNIGTKKAMSEVYAELGKRGVAGEVGKRAAKGAGLGIIAEAPTEVLESVAERYQAGLDLTGKDAMNEYKESFFGAAAAGGGIGAGAKAAGAYGEYKQARRLEDSLGRVRSEKNALDEADEGEADAGVDTGIDKSGVPLSDQQELDLAAGVRDSGPGDLEGNQLPLGSAGVGEGSVDSSLDSRIKEIDDAIAEARAYIKQESGTTTPDETRIAEATNYITQLEQAKRNATQSFNAPGQQGGFEFGAADETTQRGIDTEMTETPGFALQQEAGELPSGEVTPIEAPKEEPKSKMMLIGEGANPLAPLTSFLKSLKTATNAPQQVRDFNAEVDNLIEDVSEFIGQSTRQVSRYAEEGQPSPGKGPDVSAPLVGVSREQRLNFLDNFFNSLSNAPAGQENLTGTLSQRLRGMNLNDQMQVLGQLTNVPNINTVRGVRDLRAKFKDALAKFEGEAIQEPVEQAATYKGDETQTYAVRRAINILKNIPAKLRTPEEKAAMVYFERWGFAMAMRSAAFDLGSKTNTLFSGPIFKGQNNKEAALFQEWVKENLPAEEYRKLEATINDFKEMTARAEKLEADAERVSKGRGVVQRVTQPTGKVSEGFVEGAGMAKFKKPSDVSKLEAQRFYPMHPAMQQAISEGNLDAALSILEASGNKFHSGLAKRLRSLGLQTGIVFDQQEQLAQQILTANYSGQMEDVFKFVAATDPALFNEYFKNPTDYAKVKAGLDKITDKGVEGQVAQLKDAYQSAINMTESSGTYVAGLDVINLNRQQGGASNYTFIHELVHAATVYSLSETNFDKLTKQQQAAVVELKNLYEFAKRTGLNEYGFQNVEEFVAEAFSNQAFQDVLKSLPYSGTQAQSLWDKFTELVSKLFGMNNVLGYTLANANVIMQAPPAFTTQAAAFNANKKKSILAGKLAVGPGPMNFAEKLFGNKPGWESMKVAMPGFLQDMNDTLRKYYLGAFTLRQLNDMIGHRIPQFREFLNTTEKMLDERNRILEQTKDITDKWMRYQSKNPEEAKEMNLLMLDATLQGKDPAKGKTGVTQLDDAWNAIGKDGQEIYVAVRDFYRNRLNDYIKTNLENKKASLIARGYTQAEIDAHPAISKLGTPPIADIRQYLLKKGFTLGEIEAHEEIAAVETFFKKHNVEPYFPVRRFGRFSLQLGKGANKEFYLFESAGERRAFLPKRLAEMKAEGKAVPTKDEIFERNSIGNLTSATSKMDEFKFLQELKNIVRNEQAPDMPKLRENLEDSLEQLYFLTLPDQSIRKMFMNRKGTAGMNTDMLRAFTTSAFHMAYQHSRYKYSRELYGSIADAEARVGNEPGDEGKVNEDYLNELKERLSYIMNPTDTGTIPSFLSNVSFIWYMTAPASALVNMLGVPAIGVPVVASKFGWKNTSSKMAEYAKKFTSTGFKDDNQEWDFPTLDRFKGLTDIQRKAYEQLVADGVIDITLSHDLVGMTEAPSNLYTGRSKTAMKWLSGAFHGAEKFNREVVSMATFDLAYEKAKKAGYTDDAAFKKAISDAKDLTYKSMFDYSTLNKPRYFQNEYAKVILQFKQFSQQMTYLLARSVYEAAYKKYSANELKDIRDQLEADHKYNKVNPQPLTDADLDAMVQEYIKGARSEAIKRLGGTLGMTAMFAGVTGLPLWSVVAGTMNALQAVFGEDDEEYDFNNWFKNWANNTFGGFVGDSITRGVATQTLGVNLADRMGLNDLWFRDSRKSSDEVTALQNTLINLLGPTAGLMINSAEAVKQFNDGHLYRSMETASPAFLKNFMKGARFAEEGRAVNLKGDELVSDVSGYESTAQLFGFAPERVAQRQKSNIEMKTIEQKILTKRQDLLNAFFMAVDNDDDALMDRVMDKIDRFNSANGAVAITGAQLQKSVKTRYVNRALAESTGGISINKKLISDLEDMQAYGNPN